MSTRYDYTPLETLLLSQSLATYGTDPTCFSRISRSLQENALLRQQETFDPERLHPDALRNLYSALLEEGRKLNGYAGQEKEGNGVNGTDATSEVGSRKRKLSTPSVDSNSSPRQNSSTIIQLIDRLYVRYKDHVISYIRDDEQNFRKVQQDIREIEHGEWDQRLLSQVPVVVETRDGLAPLPDRQVDGNVLDSVLLETRRELGHAQNDQIPEVPSATVPDGREERIEMRDGSLEPHRAAASRPQSSEPVPVHDQVRSLVGEAEASKAQEVKINDTGRSPVSVNSPSQTPGEATNVEEQKSIQAQQPVTPLQQVSPPEAHSILSPVGSGLTAQRDSSVQTAFPEGRTTQQMVNDARDTFLSVKDPLSATGPPNPQSSGAAAAVYPALPSDISQQSIPLMQSTSTPLGEPAADINEKPVLPPLVSHIPLAQLTTHTSPHQPLSTTHTPLAPSTTDTSTPQAPITTHATAHPPVPSSLPTRNPPASPSLLSKPQPPMEPFTITSTLPHSSLGGQLPPVTAGTAQSPPMQEPYLEPSSYPSLPLRPSITNGGMPSASELTPAPVRKLIEENSEPKQTFTTPVMSTPSLRRGPGDLKIDTSVSSTRWKPLKEGEAYKSPKTPEAPPYSPLSEVEVSPSTRPELGRTTTSPAPQLEIGPARNSRLPLATNRNEPEQVRPKSKAKQSEGFVESTPAGRDPDGIRTRSQSLLSQLAESPWPIDSTYSERIKKEPSTSVPISGGEDTDGVEQAASNTRLRSATRLRTKASNEGRPSRDMSTLGKRKRGSPEVVETPSTGGIGKESDSIPVGHQYVLATRNFPRTTAPLLNDIGAHKFASIFAAPVKEKDAPGYRDIICQPQDLKSIKAAIANGSKAVAAYNAPDNSAGSPGQAGSNTPSSAKANTTLWIPRNPDVVPPKGIVNSAQLEKELMRMFANAVMFNPDPDRGFGKFFRNSEGDAGEADILEDDERGGVVKDTREMFEHVEKIVSDWRAAERTTEVGADRSGKAKATSGASAALEDDGMLSVTNGEIGEDGPDLDEGNVGTAKRRRRN